MDYLKYGKKVLNCTFCRDTRMIHSNTGRTGSKKIQLTYNIWTTVFLWLYLLQVRSNEWMIAVWGVSFNVQGTFSYYLKHNPCNKFYLFKFNNMYSQYTTAGFLIYLNRKTNYRLSKVLSSACPMNTKIEAFQLICIHNGHDSHHFRLKTN